MANIVTKDEVKLFLGLTGSSEDALIDSLIPSAEARLFGDLGIDGLLTATRVEKVEACRNVFFLRNWPVTGISKVNGTAYVGTSGTDFDVSYGSRLEILNLSGYLTSLNFDRFSLEYVAGYADAAHVPEQFKTAVKLALGALYNSRSSQGMASYAIGEEKVTFRSAEEKSAYDGIVSLYKNR